MALRDGDISQTSHQMTQFFARRLTLNWEVIAYLIIFGLAVFTRFHDLGTRVMSHDESLHTRFSYNLYADGDFKHTPLMHGPILFHAVAMSYALFGDSDFSARIYPAVLGIFMVMSPLLFRGWLGRWGTLIASILMLISPLLLYYHRYIREDTPAIMSSILMIWAILMYLSGPPQQRRKTHWLLVLSGAMIWNLGTKETAFMYVAAIGIFLALYWFVRMAQESLFWHGKPLFEMLSIGVLLGGVLTLGMYIILDIIKFDLIGGSVPFGTLSESLQSTTWVWTLSAIGVVILVMFATLVWAQGQRLNRRHLAQFALVFGVAMATALALVIVEELSHTTPSTAIVTEEEAALEAAIRWTPMLLTWGISFVACVIFFETGGRQFFGGKAKRKNEDLPAGEGEIVEDFPAEPIKRRAIWQYLDRFPEFDVMVVIGTLILPWATAIIPYLMKGTLTDFTNIANSLPPFVYSMIDYVPDISTADQVGQFWLHFIAWLPLMVTSLVIGLSWNWQRWLLSAGVFYGIFVFFFTSVFTNMAGLGTGMIYSLGYWLEQQGVRRGGQPQYYYLLVIMPFYEFLPVIGSVLAMISGLIFFWRKRQQEETDEQRLVAAALLEAEEERAMRATVIELDSEINNSDSATEAAPIRYESAMDPSQAVVSAEESLDEPRKKRDSELALALHQMYRIETLPFLIFWAWVAVFNLILFSLAGEKMPWLGTHLTFPLIFLTGWFVGRVVEKIDVVQFKQKGWIALIFLPVFYITLAQVLGTLWVGNAPFAGLTSQNLRDTYNFLGSFGVYALVTGILLYLMWHVGFKHLRQLALVALVIVLGVLTLRSAWMASFINYDRANEFLVYAHSATAVKTVLSQIEELSYRTTDGLDLKFAYDNEVSWPYSWYFRHFRNAVFVGANPTVQNLDNALVVVVGPSNKAKVEPILEDRYQMFQYTRMWWPMQEYFNLSADRLNNLFDFTPTNVQAPALRRAIFDIWWDRDYTRYGSAINRDFSLTKWPVQEAMYVYIRKDVASQIWEYGVGDGGVVNPLENIAPNLCVTNRQELPVLDTLTMGGDSTLNRPLGMSFDRNGNLYVAEEFGHRVSMFDGEGNFVRTIGVQGSEANLLQFTRPNSVAIAPDGTLFVADTWNYRIQQINLETLRPLVQWGQAGQFGFEARVEPTDGFWGPRDLAVSADGRIFVADTGNKRVRVYRLLLNEVGKMEATWAYDIGTGGSGDGQLNEPAGLAIHPTDGRLFVADTWNRRVSVFTLDGVFLNAFSVRAWQTEVDTGNRPFMVIDATREILYMTDPDTGRVLVYDLQGECVGSFGSIGTAPNQFTITNGLALDSEGNVYVSDGGLNRILKFAPFPLSVEEPTTNQFNDGAGLLELNLSESTPEVTAESILEEVTPEATARQ